MLIPEPPERLLVEGGRQTPFVLKWFSHIKSGSFKIERVNAVITKTGLIKSKFFECNGLLVRDKFVFHWFRLKRVRGQGHPVADFGEEPRLVFIVPTAISEPCEGLVHVGSKNQDWLVRLRHTVQAFNPFHGQAFLAWRIRPSRVQLTDQGLMVSDLSGRLQLTHSLRMCSCQRRKSIGVVFMGLGFGWSVYRLTLGEVW